MLESCLPTYRKLGSPRDTPGEEWGEERSGNGGSSGEFPIRWNLDGEERFSNMLAHNSAVRFNDFM